MVAGSDYGIVMEGNLRLRPLPALQLYSAYTRYLDGLCADSLRPRTRSGDWDPPRFLILPGFPLSIDGRNTYLDNPAFWREVEKYDPGYRDKKKWMKEHGRVLFDRMAAGSH